MSKLFSKPSGVRYVDMCIYIDNHIADEDRDDELIFKYMYLLGGMLASKARYFHSQDQYDDFAYYLACSVYKRLTDPSKIKIKSVLNYMKSVIYFRKVAFEKEVYSQIIDPKFNKQWNEDLYKQITMTNLESRDRYLLQSGVEDIISGLPATIKQCIPLVYKQGSLVYNNIYKSVLLSMLSRYTLPCKKEKYLQEKKLNARSFNEVDFYRKHLSDDDVIIWNLPQEMESIIQVILNKVKQQFISDINEVQDDFKISEEVYNNLYTDLIFGEQNEKYDTN